LAKREISLWETDSEQVLRRKDEKNFEKRVKRFEIVEKEAVEETL